MRKVLYLVLTLMAMSMANPLSASTFDRVYDPAPIRVAAKRILVITHEFINHYKTRGGLAQDYNDNRVARWVQIKEELAQQIKLDLLMLWADHFQPKHLEEYPDLHDTFWKATKLCSAVQGEVSTEYAKALLDAVEKIHHIYWDTLGRKVPFPRTIVR